MTGFWLLVLMRVLKEDPPRPVLGAPAARVANRDGAQVWNEACRVGRALLEADRDVKANRLNLKLAKNTLLPDLRFLSTYDPSSGTGDQGGGSKPNNALAQLASKHFNDWQLGLRLTRPISGFRVAHANIRIARLQLARAEVVFLMRQLQMQRFLRQQVRRLCACVPLLKAPLPAEGKNTFSIRGAVKVPGIYRIIEGRDSVLDGIDLAAGLSPRAARDCLYLFRTHNRDDDWQVLLVDILSMVRDGDPSTNYQLFPGDVLIVREKSEKDK